MYCRETFYEDGSRAMFKSNLPIEVTKDDAKIGDIVEIPIFTTINEDTDEPDVQIEYIFSKIKDIKFYEEDDYQDDKEVY